MSNASKTERCSRRSRESAEHLSPEGAAPCLLTTEAAARALSISPRLLRKLGREGEIPVVKVRSLVRFDSQDLSAWAARSKSQGDSGEVR